MGDFAKGNLSKMRASEKLLYHISESLRPPDVESPGFDPEQFNIDGIIIESDNTNVETVRLKGKKPKKKKKRDKNGKLKTIQPPRKLLETPNNPTAREMRKNLKLINDVMAKADITLAIPADELSYLNMMLINDVEHKSPLDFSRKRLRRVFLDGSRKLDVGGRFYGAWYQGVPKIYRKDILIDGFFTMEPDFSSYHPQVELLL